MGSTQSTWGQLYTKTDFLKIIMSNKYTYGKFQLDVNWVQNGPFVPGDINVFLTFQVNCPGCYDHAIPVLLMLNEALKEDEELIEELQGKTVKVALIATAFEEWEYNNMENLQAL